jgi:hypothetical protein
MWSGREEVGKVVFEKERANKTYLEADRDDDINYRQLPAFVATSTYQSTQLLKN